MTFDMRYANQCNNHYLKARNQQLSFSCTHAKQRLPSRKDTDCNASQYSYPISDINRNSLYPGTYYQ